MGSAHANLARASLTLAAGALAAVYDGQDDRLALAAVAAQAEEPHRGVGVQAVAAALAHRLQVRLLSGGGGRSEVRGGQVAPSHEAERETLKRWREVK